MRLGTWAHYRKTRPIQAMPVREAVANGLVGSDGEVHTPEADYRVDPQNPDLYLCRGVRDEFWVQRREKLLTTYEPTGSETPDGWSEFAPRPNGEGVLAARIADPRRERFSVLSDWGVPTGKRVDYLVHSISDPADTWIVDGPMFEATYEMVPD